MTSIGFVIKYTQLSIDYFMLLNCSRCSFFD